MTREQAIAELLKSHEPDESTAKRVERIEAKLDLILSVIVVQQKDACAAVGVSPDTVRDKVLRGETEILQRDGSRLNYLTLEKAGGLKVRSKRKRR